MKMVNRVINEKEYQEIKSMEKEAEKIIKKGTRIFIYGILLGLIVSIISSHIIKYIGIPNLW